MHGLPSEAPAPGQLRGFQVVGVPLVAPAALPDHFAPSGAYLCDRRHTCIAFFEAGNEKG